VLAASTMTASNKVPNFETSTSNIHTVPFDGSESDCTLPEGFLFILIFDSKATVLHNGKI